MSTAGRPREAIRLVARREIVERGRDRSLLISTAVTIAILAAIMILPKLLGGDDGARYSVAVAGERAAAVGAAAQRAARAQDATIELVAVADDAAVRRAVDAERADAGITRQADALVVRDERDGALLAALQQGSQLVRLQAQPPPPLPVRALSPADDTSTAESIAFITVLLLYVQLLGYGYWLASGVVEEKTSRIIEVLLAVIRPRELLIGKIAGIGVLGFAQLLLIGVVAVVLGLATGSVDADAEVVQAVAIALAWFVLGYAFYACLFAVAGALVPRQEDIQNTTTPLVIVLAGAFLISFGAIEEPGGTLATVLSFVPPTAPMIAPVRVIAGEMPVEQILLSIAAIGLGIAALIAIATRIYRNAILRTGTRVSLRDAWRTAHG